MDYIQIHKSTKEGEKFLKKNFRNRFARCGKMLNFAPVSGVAMEEQNIRHTAKVITSHRGFSTVEIVPENGSERCSGCRLSALCGTDREGRLTVDAAVNSHVDTAGLKPGVTVEISARAGSRTKASAILLLLPLVIFLTVAVVLVSIGASDLAAGLSAIAVSGLFYTGLYLKRGTKTPLWTIERIIS